MTLSGDLQRRLGLSDAVVIGAGSMIGAGVFVAWGPASLAAGNGLLIGLIIAAVVAFCNATSSAQLAAVHPESGGTYVYGRRQLGPFWGYVAGWGFVVGKTASCAAMGLAVGAYLWPTHQKAAAIAAIMLVTAVNVGGLSRTVTVTKVLLAVSLTALTAVLVAGWSSPDTDPGRLVPVDASLFGILQAAGFMFFAFAGYARIATLGEEVKNPTRTIPLAIPLALAAVLLVYLAVAVTVLAALPVSALKHSSAPLRAVVEASRFSSLGTAVGIAAGIASFGVLLNLVPGISRTALAMARDREFPAWFAHVDVTRSIPLRAELAVAAVSIALISLVDLRNAIAISGVAVLTYYAITNASALTLRRDQRRWPRFLAVAGVLGCVALVASLPPVAIIIGVATLGVGAGVRAITTRGREAHETMS